MNASLNSQWWARRAVVVPAVLLAAAGATAATFVSLGPTPVSGAEDDTPSAEFQVVGDGELPTTKPPLGEDRAPLSAEETGYAIQVASTDDSIPAAATDVLGEDGPEFLYADLPMDPDTTGRKAVVMLYDYTSDKAYEQLVDLEAGEVVSSRTSPDLQPPTSSSEADVAVEIAISSDRELGFKEDFEATQGTPLISPEQVAYVAGAFVYDGTTAKGQECGVDRCAQLMLQSPDGGYINTWDFVVNLSTQSVVVVN